MRTWHLTFGLAAVAAAAIVLYFLNDGKQSEPPQATKYAPAKQLADFLDKIDAFIFDANALNASLRDSAYVDFDKQLPKAADAFAAIPQPWDEQTEALYRFAQALAASHKSTGQQMEAQWELLTLDQTEKRAVDLRADNEAHAEATNAYIQPLATAAAKSRLAPWADIRADVIMARDGLVKDAAAH